MTRVLVALVLMTSVAMAKEPERPTCNGDAFETEARDSFAKGFFAQAFAQFEKAIKCRVTDDRLLRAVVSACKAWPLRTESGQATFKARVKKYFDRLSKPSQDKAVRICVPYDERGLFDYSKEP